MLDTVMKVLPMHTILKQTSAFLIPKKIQTHFFLPVRYKNYFYQTKTN